MRTAYPFEPLWEALAGPVKRTGQGLLHSDIPRAGVQAFTVLAGGGRVTVKPPTGEILLDGNLVAAVGPSSLVWFRRMEMQLATKDHNSTGAPDCHWYGLGLERNGQRVGFKVLPDGKLLNEAPV